MAVSSSSQIAWDKAGFELNKFLRMTRHAELDSREAEHNTAVKMTLDLFNTSEKRVMKNLDPKLKEVYRARSKLYRTQPLDGQEQSVLLL